MEQGPRHASRSAGRSCAGAGSGALCWARHGVCSGRHGNGLWPTGPTMAPSPAASRSPTAAAAASAGADSSNTQAPQAGSVITGRPWASKPITSAVVSDPSPSGEAGYRPPPFGRLPTGSPQCFRFRPPSAHGPKPTSRFRYSDRPLARPGRYLRAGLGRATGAQRGMSDLAVIV
jgi:hypothetical protein